MIKKLALLLFLFVCLPLAYLKASNSSVYCDTGGNCQFISLGNGTTQSFITLPAGTYTLLGGNGGTVTCGTGCTSVTSGSTNARGSVTSSSAVSSIAINWSATLPYTPVCVISSNETTALPAFTVSTTALTITTASAVTSKVFSWMCSI